MIPKIYKPLRRTKPSKGHDKKAVLFYIQETDLIKIKFPWNLSNLEEIKRIRGRLYNRDEKYWTIPLTLENCYALKKSGYYFGGTLKDWANDQYRHSLPLSVEGSRISKSDERLRDYQKQGVQFIELMKGCALVGDEMGLGKTPLTLSWLELYPEIRPVLIICPKTLKLNWEMESRIWMKDINVQILESKKVPVTGDIVIINYDILSNEFEQVCRYSKPCQYNDNGTCRENPKKCKHLKKREIPNTGWIDYLLKIKFKALVYDEIHYVKTASSLRSKACKKLSDKILFKIGLSGTPIEDRTFDIYNPIKLINPALFPNEWYFKQRYCDPKHNGFGWSFNGATNTEELFQILREKIMIRRLKKDVLKDLPDKTFSFVPLEIDNEKEYRNAERDFKQWLMDSVENELKGTLNEFMKKYDINVIDFGSHELNKVKEQKASKDTGAYKIEILKQLAAKGKMNALKEWIENFLESGQKFVIFCEHVSIVNELYKHFHRIAVKIDGSVTSAKTRHELVQRFQNDKKTRLFIGNSAAETGITLTAASNVGVVEYPWNPGKLNQRIDRVHRMGQKNAVNVYYFMAINTIDEKLAVIIDTKMKILNSVLDGRETESSELMIDLINEYKNEAL